MDYVDVNGEVLFIKKFIKYYDWVKANNVFVVLNVAGVGGILDVGCFYIVCEFCKRIGKDVLVSKMYMYFYGSVGGVLFGGMFAIRVAMTAAMKDVVGLMVNLFVFGGLIEGGSWFEDVDCNLS